MTHLTNISEEASLVLVAELISVLEQQRQSDGGPSLVAALKAALAEAWIQNPQAPPGLRIGLADAQLVLEWAENAAAERGRLGGAHNGASQGEADAGR
jgi:hypothetical protein